MHFGYNGCIILLPTERNHHTASLLNLFIPAFGKRIGILTAKGIATAESTTYMNSMLNELGKGGTTADKVLREKTGKSFSELSAEGKTVGDVLQILKDYADETNVTFTDLWSSSEAGKAVLSRSDLGILSFLANSDFVAISREYLYANQGMSSLGYFKCCCIY